MDQREERGGVKGRSEEGSRGVEGENRVGGRGMQEGGGQVEGVDRGVCEA